MLCSSVSSFAQANNFLVEEDARWREVELKVVTSSSVEWTNPQSTFHVGDLVYFRLSGINHDPLPLTVGFSDYYLHSIPQLFKVGVPIPYRPEMKKLVEARQKPPIKESFISVKMAFNREKLLGGGSLDKWYEHLSPGIYELFIEYGPRYGGKRYDSKHINFEIISSEGR